MDYPQRGFSSLQEAEQRLWPDGHPDDKVSQQADSGPTNPEPSAHYPGYQETRPGPSGPLRVPSGWLVVALIKISDLVEAVWKTRETQRKP